MDIEAFQGIINHHVFQNVNVRKPIIIANCDEVFDVIDVHWDEDDDAWYILIQPREPLDGPTLDQLNEDTVPQTYPEGNLNDPEWEKPA